MYARWWAAMVVFCMAGWMAGCGATGGWNRRSELKGESVHPPAAMFHYISAKMFEFEENYYGAIVELRESLDLDSTSVTLCLDLSEDYLQIG